MQHMQILTTILKPYHTLKTVLQLTSSPCAIGLGAPCVSLPVYFYGHRREPGQRPACTHARACTGWTSYWKGLRMEPSKSRLAVEQYGDTSPIAFHRLKLVMKNACNIVYIRSLIITRRRIESKTLPPESWHPGRDTQRCYSPIARCKKWPLPQYKWQSWEKWLQSAQEMASCPTGDAFWTEWFRHFP